MGSVPLAARLVEVIADRGEAAAERYRYGSGCIMSGRTVLTAAHVVAGAQRVQVRDPNKKITATPSAAAAVDGRDELWDVIASVDAQVRELEGVSEGDREDIRDELRKAREAGEGGDHGRLLAKLQRAQELLLELTPSVPASVIFCETVGKLIQRAHAVG